MAILHGLAGQYGKQRAKWHSQQIIAALILSVVLTSAGLGFVFGYFLPRGGAILAGIASLVATGLFLVVWRYVDRWIDKVAVERIKHLRGGQAEALVAYLLKGLDNNWHVFNGLKLIQNSDIDHIVVGPGGLFCISTKSHRGAFTGTTFGVLHNGQACDFAKQAQWQTMTLRDRLATDLGENVPWVQAVLAIPFGWIEHDAFGGKAWLAHSENLVERIAPERPVKTISKRQVNAIVEVLEGVEAQT